MLKSLELCQKEGTLYPWPGSQQEAQLRPCMRLFASGLSWRELVVYPAYLIRRNVYAQISCCLQRHLAQVIDRRLELVCDRVL